ncbi:shufflon system plasmid conjugative transfer pilus tip adhesin PilV, partial [Escherichia coli]
TVKGTRLITSEGYLMPGKTVTANPSCSPAALGISALLADTTGLVAHDSTGATLSCQSGAWKYTTLNFTTSTYNIGKNTYNKSIGVHAYCAWTYLNGSPFGGFQQVYSDSNNNWYVNNYAWDNYASGGTISVTCLNLPNAGV